MLEILRIAPLSSLQDQGRDAWRYLGVPMAGPLDEWSHGVANALLGNNENAAVMEVGFGRSQLRFHRAALIAITGARTPARVDNMPVPAWRPLALAAGATLSLEPAQLGALSYLAVAGGWLTPPVLGSRSALTQTPGGPTWLRRADRLEFAAVEHYPGMPPLALGAVTQAASWWADGEPLLDLSARAGLRVIDGSHSRLLEDRRALYTQQFELSAASNRMAAALRGSPLQISQSAALISEPVVPGTVQLPPDGLPVILLNDAQTIGGYARIGHIASIDLARLAQRRPGSIIQFEPISVDAAQRLWLWRRQRLMRLRIAALDRLCG